jgi:hypothetical protein
MLKRIYDSERLVAAIAERRVLGLLAVAQPDLLGLRQIELLRAKTGAFMAAVAVWLMAAQAAGTPPVVSSRQFNSDGLFLVDFGKIFHVGEFGRRGAKVKALRFLTNLCYLIVSSTSRTSPGPR